MRHIFSVDDLGLHQLKPKIPVGIVEALKVRAEVVLDAKQWAAYPGDYVLAPTFSIVITTESGRLFAQATGQPKLELMKK